MLTLSFLRVHSFCSLWILINKFLHLICDLVWCFQRVIIKLSIWLIYNFLKILTEGYAYQFQRGRERKINIDVTEKINQLPPKHTGTRDLTRNPSMCPDQGSNPQPTYMPWERIEPTTLGVWDDTPTKWAMKPGLNCNILCSKYI